MTVSEHKTADLDYTVHALIEHRWSPRIFSTQKIGEEALQQLFEAVRWSASSNNEQPWRLIYTFQGSEAYRKLFRCLSDFNQQWVGNAPVLLLTVYKETFASGKDNFHALHDLGLAMGSLTFQAQSMDIAVHQMAGVDWQQAQEVFAIPPGYHATTAVALGYYGGETDELPEDLRKMEIAKRSRMPQSQFAGKEKWPEPVRT